MPMRRRKSSRFGQGVLDLIEKSWQAGDRSINGFALGGGCETAMACTIRIAAEHAKFGQPEVKLGLLPGVAVRKRLPRLVGKGRALQLILTGETISAQEAYRIGLVNEVVPRGQSHRSRRDDPEADLRQRADRRKVLAGSGQQGMDTSQAEGFALKRPTSAFCAATEDKKEGTSAFLEKRTPQFRGR